MRYFQNHISRLLTFIIALQILNMSIYAPNARMVDNKRSSDNFNYIDTYMEFFAEVILKFDNAIPEPKDRQQKELRQYKQFTIVFEKIQPFFNSLYNDEKVILTHFSLDKHAYQFVKEINPPPPKA